MTRSTWDVCVRDLVQQELTSLYVASFNRLNGNCDSLYTWDVCVRALVKQELNSLYVASFHRLSGNSDSLYLGCLCPRPCPAGTEQPLCDLLPLPKW